MEQAKILVWDLPVRLFHWLLALTFAGAFLTVESEGLRGIHVALGYTFAGLLVFRLVWGFIGSRYARFASFAFGPRAVLEYLGSLLKRQPDHHVGHNPAGSWVIYGLIVLGVITGASGYALHSEIGGDWVESLHEGVANAMLGLAIFHVIGAVVGSVMHSENLVGAMVTGYKTGRPAEAITRTHWVMAAALAVAVALPWTGIVPIPDLGTKAASRTDGPSEHSRHRAHRHDG